MFSKLIEIKAIRESRLRQQLADEEKCHKENQKKLHLVIAHRTQLQQEWREIGRRKQGSLSGVSLMRLRQQLAGFHLQDRELEAHWNALQQQIHTWPDIKKHLEQRIRRANIEQEKLKYLAENYP